MPIAALLFYVVAVVAWLVAIGISVRGLSRSTDHRTLRTLALLVVAASLPTWHYWIGPWSSKRAEANQLARASQGDQLAEQDFASLCARNAPVEVIASHKERGHVEIGVTEHKDNFMFELRNSVRMYLPDGSPCLGDSCIRENPAEVRTSNSSGRFLLSIGKAEVIGTGRIRRYELTLSLGAGQPAIGRAAIYRLHYFSPTHQGDAFCPDVRRQLKSMLEQVFPYQYAASAG